MNNDRSSAEESGKFFPEQKKLSVGIEGLDNVLEGGLPENHIYLVEGEPGTGKTTLALQFLLEGVERGESVLYVTLSETKNELINVARSHRWSLDGLNIYELIPSDESLKPESQYTIFHPSEIELNETTSAILREVERLDPQRIVFDSLSEMRLLARDPLRYRRQILALKQYFAPRDCTVILLDDKTEDVSDLQVHSIVHGVLKLEHLAVEYSAERRRLRVSKLRGTRFRGGYHDFNIETGGLSVFPRLVSADHRPNAQKENVTTGVPELDNLLGGGLVRGTSTLIIGPAGAGKSSLMTHFAAAFAGRGEKSAIFVFDEIEETFVKRAKGIGTPIDQFIANGLITMRQIDPAALSPGEFAHLILKAVKQDGVKFVVIDSLNGYLDSMPEERFLTVQMHELLTFLNRQGVITVLIMGQHGFLGSDMKTPVDVSYLADSVLLLRYFESHGAVRRALSVVKKRTGAHESTLREMDISSDGIRVGKVLNEFQGVLTGVPVYDGGNRTISDFDAEE